MFRERDFRDTGKDNPDAVGAYRRLKLAMESLRDRPNEAMFFKLEQVALRTTKQASRWDRLLSLLYSVSSNYGQSSFRPFLLLLLTTLFFFYVYYVYKCVLDVPIDVVQATLEPLFSPFGVFRPGAEGEGYVVRLLMLLQSLLSFVWITLFLLALRRRFKLD